MSTLGRKDFGAKFIFLDLETTGLDEEVDQITEAAWITDDHQQRQMFVRHTRMPNEWVLNSSDYVTRILPAKKVDPRTMLDLLIQDCERLRLGLKSFVPAFEGFSKVNEVYIVGANVAFDHAFLKAAFRKYHLNIPYHYHVIDIEAMVMGAYNLPFPPRLKDLRQIVGLVGQNEAPHTALADAHEVRLAFEALRTRTFDTEG